MELSNQGTTTCILRLYLRVVKKSHFIDDMKTTAVYDRSDLVANNCYAVLALSAGAGACSPNRQCACDMQNGRYIAVLGTQAIRIGKAQEKVRRRISRAAKPVVVVAQAAFQSPRFVNLVLDSQSSERNPETIYISLPQVTCPSPLVIHHRHSSRLFPVDGVYILRSDISE
jgi:hypothetical protein